MTESSTVNETEGLKYTLLLAVIIFLILLTCFESIRGIKNIFLKRINRKFQVFHYFIYYVDLPSFHFLNLENKACSQGSTKIFLRLDSSYFKSY